MINRLAEVPDLTVLVLDDYHTISVPAVHEVVAFLLDHLPERLRLVIATRADSLHSISRLRARGQLVEIREAELRFDSQEAARFFNEHMGLRLNLPEIELLTRRTEGWAAGLQMAALALRSLPDAAGSPDRKSEELIRSFSGSHRFVLDYLMDEVFSCLPPDTQSFMVSTSILDRFCAGLCEKVLGQTGPGERRESVDRLLAFLLDANLFLIPLDEERCWYRYHHLFAELLRSRLRQEASPEKIAALQRRASAWFAARGLTEEAIYYALQAGDFETAAGLVEGYAQQVISRGRQATLQRWLAAIPEAYLAQRPRLRIYQAWGYYMDGKASAALQMLEDAGHLLEGLPQSGELQALKRELLSILAMSSISTGDARRVIQMAQAALDDMPETELTPRARLLFAQGMAYSLLGDWLYYDRVKKAFDLARQAVNLYLAAGILYNQAFGMMVFSYRLRDAMALCQQIIDFSTPAEAGSDQDALAGLGLVAHAGINLEWNNLDLASRQLEQGMDLVRKGGLTLADFVILLTQARLAQARGGFPGASAALEEAAQVGTMISAEMNLALLAQAQVRLYLAAGQIEAAARCAYPDELLPGQTRPANLQEIWDISQASVRLAQGKPEEALAQLDSCIAQAEAGVRRACVLEGSLLKALALHALGCDALAPLLRAFGLGKPECVTRLYLELGASPRALLLACRPRLGEYSAEADRILQILGEPIPAAPKGPDLVEQLTPREMDVLRLLYAGKSNQEIADTLFFSLSAVKKHTGAIYGKLGVASRAQAFARVRELRLV